MRNRGFLLDSSLERYYDPAMINRKLALSFLSAACLASASAFAYLGFQWERPTKPGGGGIRLSPAVCDFGSVGHNRDLIGKIRIENGLREPVIFTNIAKSCSCSDIVVEPSTIPPGGSAEATVVWKVGKRHGKSSESLVFLYSTPTSSSQPLHAKLTAEVVPAVECSVDEMRFDESKTRQTVTIQGRLGHTVKLSGASSNHGSLKVACNADANEITVEFDRRVAGWEYGNLHLVIATGCHVEPEIR